jgi:hypothetical protein
MKRLESCAAVLLAAFSLAGCSPYEKTTSVAFRDPSAVRYVDEASGKKIPYSNGDDRDADHEIKKDDVRLGNHYAELIVTGYEAPDGSLVTKWSTDRLMKWGAEPVTTTRVAVLPNTGTITLDDHVAVDTSANNAEFPVCGRFDNLGMSHAPFRHPTTNSIVGTSCDRPHDLVLTATTPWSNVEAVHHLSKNDPGRNIMMAVVTTALTGIAGTTLLVLGDHGDHPAATVGGYATFALGGVIDLAVLVPAIFSKDRDDVVYDAKR